MLQLLYNGIATGLLVALPAVAISLLFGVLRFANFAIGAQLTAGAYLVYAVNVGLGWPFAAALLAGALLSALLALALDLLVYARLAGRPPVIWLVASMGVALVLENAVRFFAGSASVGYSVAASRPWRVLGIRVSPEQLAGLGASLGALLLVWLLLNHSRYGRALRAVADNPALAPTRGIRARALHQACWAISGALCAIGGALIGLDTTLDPYLGWNYVIPVFAAAILGGFGNPRGAFFGALVLSVMAEAATQIVPTHYRTLVAFTVLAALLLLRPQGLFGHSRITR